AVSRLVAERGGYDLMPELGYKPTNKYLPPRPRQNPLSGCSSAPAADTETTPAKGLLRWVDQMLSR
ncbi:MAG: 4Fe-4S dicluster domain-containing protein, partial [Roseicyclus sp.]